MNWPFISVWLLIFASIIAACSMFGKVLGSTIIGVVIGLLCVAGILIYAIIRTPWFY